MEESPRRLGNPRTDAERQVRHQELYGENAPVERGQRFKSTKEKLDRGIVE